MTAVTTVLHLPILVECTCILNIDRRIRTARTRPPIETLTCSGVARGGARGAVAPGAELRGALKSWGKFFFYRSNKNFKSRSKVRLSIISLIIVRYRLYSGSLKEKLYSDHRTTIVWIGVFWPEIVRRGR